MAGAAEPLARMVGPAPTRVGLVAPLPPQVGGVASVAEWLLEHGDELGVRYETFDLARTSSEVGGRWSAGATLWQARLVASFVRWLQGSPRSIHFCVSCTTTGLLRDVTLLAAARVANRKSIVHVHGSDLSGAVDSPFRRRALRAAARLSAERIALSPALAEMLGSIGVPARWIPNPVRLRPAATPDRNGRGSLRLLLVGRFGERKGCFELIEAVADARSDGIDASLAVVGSEERAGEAARLARLVDERGLTDAVRFAGEVDRDGLGAWYRDADVICLPSKREGLPMALLEGMAFGLPVLATRVGGIPDLVEDERSGYLVDAGDVAGLTDRIRKLADPGLRRGMGEAASRRAAEFASPDLIVERWREVYASVSDRG